jgi:hypothetical protein
MIIDCPPLENFDPVNWAEVSHAFHDSPPVSFQQHWREEPEEAFRGGEVRTGWTADGLWVYAELKDEDVFNPATEFNSFFFMHGDVFEIFAMPSGQDAYYELHVGPENQQMQMRIPSATAFAAQQADEAKGWMVTSPLMKSWTRVDPERNRWSVLVMIPLVALVEEGDPKRDWKISFSRYDYTRGAKRPVLSSTSPHEKLGYHRQHEWATLRFSY